MSTELPWLGDLVTLHFWHFTWW